MRRPLIATALLSWAAAGCGLAHSEPAPAPAASSPASTAVAPHASHTSAKLTSLQSPVKDALGRPILVACVSCHSLRKAEAVPTSMEQLKEFHRGLRFEHGQLRCESCHVAGRAQEVHLASGERVPLEDAIRLCGQCHGQQLRDYRRGAHGGMNGHWDLARGGRVRNHCVDCHDAHLPRFQPTLPVLAPRDRGLR
jgi:hypothetical protein